MELLQGRRGLVIGVANERSLAYAIAGAAHDAGARLALTYQNEKLASRVAKLGDQLGADLVTACDVTNAAALDALVSDLQERWGALDFLVHSVAYADRDALAGRLLDTPRDAFLGAVEVSVYSLVATVRACEPLLRASDGAPSVLTLTYQGSQHAVPNYHLMGVSKAGLEAAVRYLAAELGPDGIRVNALSPGPIKTLSAAGIPGLRRMLAHTQKNAPLRRNTTHADVAGAALYCLSDLSQGTTGEVVHVDAGYNVVGGGAPLDPAAATNGGGSTS